MLIGKSAGDNMKKKIDKTSQFISKAELNELYTNQKLSDQQIGEIFGMSYGRIHRLRSKYNIKAIEYYERHHKQVLNQKEKEFLVGTLLGDGHLRWRNKIDKRAYPQLMLEQTTSHFEYMVWLKDQMKEWLFDQDKQLKQSRKLLKRTGKVYHSYAIQTICHPVFIEFFNGFYMNGKKNINIDFIDKYFTEFSFAVWLMDDGTISKNRNIAICSHSFSKDENQKLKELLQKKFSLSPNIWASGSKSYLGFSKKDSEKITELLKDLVIPSMQYKLISSETTKEANDSLIDESFEGIVQLQK